MTIGDQGPDEDKAAKGRNLDARATPRTLAAIIAALMLVSLLPGVSGCVL